jgi:hypothetical protein
MLSVVCWKWKPYTDFGHQKFTAEHVNTLASMVARHYQKPHEVVCITDDPEGIDPRVRTVPLWDHHRHVPNPMGYGYPRCYSRLYAFSEEFKDIIPNRFVSVDLDCVIVDDMTPVWDVDDDAKFWMHALRTPMYNGSMWLHKPGTRPQVWTDFDPDTSPELARSNNCRGSDQGWFSYIIPGEATWGFEDGVYNWDTHVRNRGYRLPADARIVFFCGQMNPWDEEAQLRAGWIRDHYR